MLRKQLVFHLNISVQGSWNIIPKNQVHFLFSSICHALSLIQQGETINVFYTSSCTRLKFANI